MIFKRTLRKLTDFETLALPGIPIYDVHSHSNKGISGQMCTPYVGGYWDTSGCEECLLHLECDLLRHSEDLALQSLTRGKCCLNRRIVRSEIISNKQIHTSGLRDSMYFFMLGSSTALTGRLDPPIQMAHILLLLSCFSSVQRFTFNKYYETSLSHS